jgi:D-threo-aldose 1-dehydrogenase
MMRSRPPLGSSQLGLRSPMETVSLTPTIASTRIGFGCAGLMQDVSSQRRQQVLAAAFDEGIRHFDIARMYGLGAAEGELGKFAHGRREDMIIATKFGIEAGLAPGRLARFQGPARALIARYPRLRTYVKRRSEMLHRAGRYDAATARKSLETSLRELRTDYVDLFFLHGPTSPDIAYLSDTCAYLEDALQAGYLRAWGVAGEEAPCLEIMNSLPSSTILQIRNDILDRPRPDATDLKPGITYGILSRALDLIVTHVAGSATRRERWLRAVGVDCGSSDTVATLLQRDALARNHNGVVLLSTTHPERLMALRALFEHGPDEDLMLAAFSDRVSEELIPASHDW